MLKSSGSRHSFKSSIVHKFRFKTRKNKDKKDTSRIRLIVKQRNNVRLTHQVQLQSQGEKRGVFSVTCDVSIFAGPLLSGAAG